jgi:NlpC/P60 family putative phage cell wall peptidase
MTTREHIVAAARSWLGTPYRHQASVRGVGCDCLGLIRGLWRELVGDEPEAMPAYTRDWGDVTGSEPLLAAAHRNLTAINPSTALSGDILVFRMQAGVAKHAGVLTNWSCDALPRSALLERGGHFIHAVEDVGVAEVALTRWWRRRIVAAFTFPGVN